MRQVLNIREREPFGSKLIDTADVEFHFLPREKDYIIFKGVQYRVLRVTQDYTNEFIYIDVLPEDISL